jgi:hypothetical protein
MSMQAHYVSLASLTTFFFLMPCPWSLFLLVFRFFGFFPQDGPMNNKRGLQTAFEHIARNF